VKPRAAKHVVAADADQDRIVADVTVHAQLRGCFRGARAIARPVHDRNVGKILREQTGDRFLRSRRAAAYREAVADDQHTRGSLGDTALERDGETCQLLAGPEAPGELSPSPRDERDAEQRQRGDVSRRKGSKVAGGRLAHGDRCNAVVPIRTRYVTVRT